MSFNSLSPGGNYSNSDQIQISLCSRLDPLLPLHPYTRNKMSGYILGSCLITARKVIFSEACVKNSVHRGRGSTRVPPGTSTPRRDQVHPPRTRYISPTRYTPGSRYTPLGPGTQPPPWEQCMPEIRVTSGRYASYWNAFLLYRFLK